MEREVLKSKIGIIGCGWLGTHLAEHLKNKYTIFATTRSEERKNKLQQKGFQVSSIDFNKSIITDFDFRAMKAIIVCVPFSMRKSWDELSKIFKNIITFLKPYQGQVFLMSSIGIYPEYNGVITEETFLDSDLKVNFIGIENLCKKEIPQLNILRLGGLMGGSRIFSKYTVKNEELRVNHVHYKDICNIIEIMMDRKLGSKLYNIVAPLHPSKREVILYQKEEIFQETQQGTGRWISSEKMMKDLAYQYEFPDPRKFI